MMFAGAYPERVQKLVMIDGFGPVTQRPEKAAQTLRKAIDAEALFLQRSEKFKSPKLYESLSVAIEARVRTVSTYPGKQFISREAAATLLARCYHLMCVQKMFQ